MKLKPCPFCGNIYRGKFIASEYHADPMECPKCGARGPYLTMDERKAWKRARSYHAKNLVVAKAWNRRAETLRDDQK